MQVIRGATLGLLTEQPNIFIEHATLEGVGGLEILIREFPYQRVLFGSHFPFFLLQSAIFKLEESELGAKIRQAIASENAESLLENA